MNGEIGIKSGRGNGTGIEIRRDAIGSVGIGQEKD